MLTIDGEPKRHTSNHRKEGNWLLNLLHPLLVKMIQSVSTAFPKRFGSASKWIEEDLL